MNIASRLRLCALPLAVSLVLAACGGASTPPDGQKAAEPPAAPAAAETALPAGWQRVAGAEMPAVHGQKAAPISKSPIPAGSSPVATTSSR